MARVPAPTHTHPPADGGAVATRLSQALSLQQLQINRLLNITQAINSSAEPEQLFRMYADFLAWELGIDLMALYLLRDDSWERVAQIGFAAEAAPAADPVDQFERFAAITEINAEAEVDPRLRQFDFVIPVSHTDGPIAYVLLGGVEDTPEHYNKVQFVATITNIIAVAIENRRLFRSQLEQERYRAELTLASEIQRSLVPERLPSTPHYELAALYRPRFGVGGDFYSAQTLADGSLLFCLADIAGKGTGAALLMSNFEASFWTLAQNRTDLASFVHDLNRALFRVTRGERFVTLIVGEYQPSDRRLRYVNAGHNPPLFVQPSAHEPGRVTELRRGCTFLGAFEELPAVDVGTQEIDEAGGVLLCYTDGVTELAAPDGEMFGEDRLAQFAADRLGPDRLEGAPPATVPEAFNDDLLTRLLSFQGEAEPTDDLSVLTLLFRS